MFNHFGGPPVGADNGRIDAAIQASDLIASTLRVGSDNDPVRLKEVGYRAALSEKLRIEDKLNVGIQQRPEPEIDSFRRANGCGALEHHSREMLLPLQSHR